MAMADDPGTAAEAYRATVWRMLSVEAANAPPPIAEIAASGRAMAARLRAALGEVRPPPEMQALHQRMLQTLDRVRETYPESEGWARQNALGEEWLAILVSFGLADAEQGGPTDSMSAGP
ncbi:MAG: hypothetical protein C0506_00180 [Anaerolinea sp.]|nr:hypothetical protein [Anaerolinea sp.]